MTQKLFQKRPRVLRLRRDPFSPLPQQAVTWNARSVLNLAKSYWWPHVLARETYRRKDIIQSQAERIQPKSANVLGGPSVPVLLCRCCREDQTVRHRDPQEAALSRWQCMPPHQHSG